jgi:transposase InsO family protein
MHNAYLTREGRLAPWEVKAILDFYQKNFQNGYRRITFMMMDADVVAVSPSTVYRVLKNNGLLRKWNRAISKKGTGFVQPLRPHEHWHIDITYINLGGTLYYLCSLIDGYSRYVVEWEIREEMKETAIEVIIQRAKEKFPAARPRIISDNGPQFISKDFREFIRISGMTHVRTSPYYPQSNGKQERFQGTAKTEGIRPMTPSTPEEANRVMTKFIEYYNNVRLHSGIGYISPLNRLVGRAEEIELNRKKKLAEARERRSKGKNETP